MVIFHSYVKLPEGTNFFDLSDFPNFGDRRLQLASAVLSGSWEPVAPRMAAMMLPEKW